MKFVHIVYVSPIDDANPENDNIDIHVHLGDGRVYGLLVATPNNVFWCMANDGNDYYFGTPILFVRVLTRECVEKAVAALLSADNGRWLQIYGALQKS